MNESREEKMALYREYHDRLREDALKLRSPIDEPEHELLIEIATGITPKTKTDQ